MASPYGISMPPQATPRHTGLQPGGDNPLLQRAKQPELSAYSPSPEQPEKASKWSTAQGAVCVLHLLLGTALTAWAVFEMPGLRPQGSALLLGVSAACIAVLGMVGSAKNILSSRTGYMVACGFIGLMAIGHVRGVTRDTESDCFMAEAMMRIDHMEESLLKIKHEELLQNVLGRLQGMHDDILDMEKGAVDITEQHLKQKEVAAMDTDFITEKMERVERIARQAQMHLEAEIANAATEADNTEGMIESNQRDPEAVKKLQANLLALNRRLGTLKRKEAVMRDVLLEHDKMQSNNSLDGVAYKNLVLKVLRNAVDPQLAGSLNQEREQVTQAQEALDRLRANEYHLMNLDGFKERHSARLDQREAAKKKFEDTVGVVLEGHSNEFSSKEKFVASLKKHLDGLPEICLRELQDLWVGVWLAYGLAVVSAAGAYCALNAAMLQTVRPWQ